MEKLEFGPPCSASTGAERFLVALPTSGDLLSAPKICSLKPRPPEPIDHQPRTKSCAASDHAAAAPPSSVMNARLFIRSPRRRGRAEWAEFQGRSRGRS